MRGEDRRDLGTREPGEERRRFDAGIARAGEREGEASRPARRARIGVRAAPAMLLLVLGDVEQVREVAERAHQVQRLVEIERVELALELGTARRFLVERHGRLAYALD